MAVDALSTLVLPGVLVAQNRRNRLAFPLQAQEIAVLVKVKPVVIGCGIKKFVKKHQVQLMVWFFGAQPEQKQVLQPEAMLVPRVGAVEFEPAIFVQQAVSVGETPFLKTVRGAAHRAQLALLVQRFEGRELIILKKSQRGRDNRPIGIDLEI